MILIIPYQPINDDQQIKFSKRFGPLEGTRGVNPGAGTPFARQSNLDIETGNVIPENDRRMFYQKANMLWHADSTFKAIPSLCSVLSARTVPIEGGATEFASTRAAYKCLSEIKKREIEELVVEHDFDSGELLALFDEAEKKERIIELISRPAEKAKPWHEYREIFVTDKRIEAGVEFWEKNHDSLERARRTY